MRQLSVFITTLFLLVSAGVHALTAKEIMEKVRENYNESIDLEYQSTYKLYKGHTSSEVVTSYSGYTYRQGKNVYQKIDQTEFVYGTDFFLKISHGEKAVLLDLAQEAVNMNIDLERIFDYCIEQKVNDMGDAYEVVLIYKYGSDSPFSVVKVKVDKKRFYMQQLDLYYATLQDFSTNYAKQDNHRPHLRIAFDRINMNPKEKSSIFNMDSYLIKSKGILTPTGVCAGYELIDSRIK